MSGVATMTTKHSYWRQQSAIVGHHLWMEEGVILVNTETGLFAILFLKCVILSSRIRSLFTKNTCCRRNIMCVIFMSLTFWHQIRSRFLVNQFEPVFCIIDLLRFQCQCQSLSLVSKASTASISQSHKQSLWRCPSGALLVICKGVFTSALKSQVGLFLTGSCKQLLSLSLFITFNSH